MAVDRVAVESFHVWRVVVWVAIVAAWCGVGRAEAQEKRWSEADLVAAYGDLRQSGGLDGAIRHPTRPSDPPQPAFLSALAWFAAETRPRPARCRSRSSMGSSIRRWRSTPTS